MSKLSVLIPTYNEEENVEAIASAVIKEITENLPGYDYEIVFIDNDSKDRTRELERKLCAGNHRIKAIFNAKNFGQFNSPYYGILQTTGDCTINLVADFQDPVEMIPELVHEWEKGYKIVVCQKTSSDESRFMYFLRTCYYKMIRKMSNVPQIDHFTGFGLYDRDFVNVMRNLHDPTPFLRGVVAELGWNIKYVTYKQNKRRAGKTHNNFMTLYDGAMLSFTTYTKMGLRLATFVGFGVAAASFIIGLVYLILKLIYWDRFAAGQAPMMLGMFFLGAVILIFLGLMGEYVMSINSRVMNRPLVIESERINFDDETAKCADKSDRTIPGSGQIGDKGR